MEQYTQVLIIPLLGDDILAAFDEFNSTLKDLQFNGNIIRDATPLMPGDLRLWRVLIQKSDKGIEDARGNIDKAAQ